MPQYIRTGEGAAGYAMDAIFGEDWRLPDDSMITAFLAEDVQIVSQDGVRLGARPILEVRTANRGTLATGQEITRLATGQAYRVADMADDSDGWVVCSLARRYGA